MTRLTRTTLAARAAALLEAWRAMGDHAIMRHDLPHAPPGFLL